MSAISLKSITGITSITTPAGVDNVFTVHTNDTTERFRIDQTGNQNIVGIVTVTKDLDVDGQTSLDHTTIAGIVTFLSGSGLDLATHNRSAGMRIINNGNPSSDGMYIGYGNANNGATRLFGGGLTSNPTVINSTGVSIPNDLDVDGHTNLDNVNIAGVTTTSGNLFVDGNIEIPSSGRYLKIWTGGTQGIRLNHGGTYGELDNLTGMMRIKAGSVNLANRFGNYNFINCAANGSVDLYYDAQNHTTPKLATSATGVTIDGTAVAGGLDISGDIDVEGHTNLDNVSIAGVSTFSGLVNVNGNASQSAYTPLLLQNSAAAGTGSNPDVVKIAFGSNGVAKGSIRAAVYGEGHMTFHTNNDTEKLRITADGKVGINQTSPTCQLQIDSGSSGAGTVTHLELNHKGNDTNDAVKLNFARAGGDIGSIVLEKVASNNTTDFIFNTRSFNTVSESMRITGAGKVGIGTAIPQDELHIEDADPAIRLTDSANGQYAFIDGNSGNLILHSDKGASGSSSTMKFGVDNQVKMTLDHNGHLDLATGNLQFANGAGLDFSNVPATSGNTLSSDGNKLDDYEEGYYNPTLSPGNGSVTSTTSVTLRYVKVGRLVHLVGRLHFTTSQNDLSSFTISLPFANASSNKHDTSVCTHVIRGNGGDPVQGIRILRIGPGGTTMYMNNHEGQQYGDLGTTSPHININFSYFAA